MMKGILEKEGRWKKLWAGKEIDAFPHLRDYIYLKGFFRTTPVNGT